MSSVNALVQPRIRFWGTIQCYKHFFNKSANLKERIDWIHAVVRSDHLELMAIVCDESLAFGVVEAAYWGCIYQLSENVACGMK